MPQNYARAGLAIVVDALAMAIVTAILALLYWLATGANGDYLAIVSNALFYLGGIILAFGALLELFRLKKTQEIRQLLFYPRQLFARWGIFRAAGGDEMDEGQGAGWLLVFLGAMLIVFALVASFNYLI